MPDPHAAPASNATPGRLGRRIVMIAAICIAAVAALVWAVKTILYSRAHASTDDAYVEGHLVPVLARVGGYAIRVNGVENQHVREVDTLVVIDDAEYRSKLAQARADLAAAQVAVGMRGYTGQALAQVHTAEGQSAATDAQIAAAQANYDKAVSDLRRTQTLADQQIISRQQLDAAQAAADAARAALIGAQKQAAAAGATVTNAEAGVRLATARLAASQAEEVQAELNESYTHIIAPVTGVLSRKQVEVGQLVQAGQTLFTVVADTGVWIDANYKETQLNDIHMGQPVEFDVDAYDGRTFNGVVESIAPATGAEFALLPPDNATGNFTKVVQRITVRVRPTDPPDPAHPLRPGMSVNCHIETGQPAASGQHPAAASH
jgi:membrane fusion protein, multidrug efflux system